MEKDIPFDLNSVDYVQSANTLFHFMKRQAYLSEALENQALMPRYCKENIEYLHIANNGIEFKEALVLQECFCDIPLHKINDKFTIKGFGDNFDLLDSDAQNDFENKNTHPDFYGEYAIAFSKDWGEKNNLRPVNYVSTDQENISRYSNFLNSAIAEDSLKDIYADEIIERLSLTKPLKGNMNRNYQSPIRPGDMEVSCYKNFYDEREWRYVPDLKALKKAGVEPFIANPQIISQDQNANLSKEQCKCLQLSFKYEDIRYLIVPDLNARVDIIKIINGLPTKNFTCDDDARNQKNILMSKILVLEEIRKDF